MTDVRDLPFDQYQRYELVRSLLDEVRADGERFTILDVGGRTALLREFLPDDRVELVDVVASDASGLVLGSGAELPFKDGAFDAVCAFDTLEHVPPKLRDDFVRECGRVAKRYVVLAGPYDSPRVAAAEETLLDFLRARLDWEHQYLLEHRQNGLPSMDAASAILEEAGAQVRAIGHGELSRWLALMCVELYIEHETLLADFAPQLYRFYNEHLFAFDHGPEVYRHALVAAFDGAPLPTAEGTLGDLAEAPAAVDEVIAEAGRELLRYDSLRDTYLPEMDRLHGVVRSVEEDLAGHRAEIEALTADLTEHRATVESLKGDLDSERREGGKVLAEKSKTIGDLEEIVSARETTLEEQAEVIAEKDTALAAQAEHMETLSADLEGHRAALTEVRELRAAELQELEARGQRLEEVNRELFAQNEIVRRAHLQLEATVRRIEEFVDREERVRGAVRRADECSESLEERLRRAEEGELSLEDEIGIIIDARDLRLAQRDEARARVEELTRAVTEANGALEQTREELTETRGALGDSEQAVKRLGDQLRAATAERDLLRTEFDRLWNRLGRNVLLRWLTGARKLG